MTTVSYPLRISRSFRAWKLPTLIPTERCATDFGTSSFVNDRMSHLLTMQMYTVQKSKPAKHYDGDYPSTHIYKQGRP